MSIALNSLELIHEGFLTEARHLVPENTRRSRKVFAAVGIESA